MAVEAVSRRGILRPVSSVHFPGQLLTTPRTRHVGDLEMSKTPSIFVPPRKAIDFNRSKGQYVMLRKVVVGGGWAELQLYEFLVEMWALPGTKCPV